MDDKVSNYTKYRGKCKQLCEEAIEENQRLTLVRGHYWEPLWNTIEEHWWTVDEDGVIFDPSKLQFPSKGNGEYTPFNGIVSCAECGKEMKEDEAEFESNYAFCSYKCHGKFVGVFT